MSRPAGALDEARMAAVEREMDARIEWALTKSRDVRHAVQDATADEQDDEVPEQQVQFIRATVLDRERTPEWEGVLARIDAGELTWRQIVESYLARNMEPDVERAFRSLHRVPELTAERMTELAQQVKAELGRDVELPDAESSDDLDDGQRPDGRWRFVGHDDDDDDDWSWR